VNKRCIYKTHKKTGRYPR